MWSRETAGVYRLRQERGQVVSVERVVSRGMTLEQLAQRDQAEQVSRRGILALLKRWQAGKKEVCGG